jgi:hypothetical protein
MRNSKPLNERYRLFTTGTLLCRQVYVTLRRMAKNQIDNGYAFDIVGRQAQGDAKPSATYYLTERPLHPNSI